MGRGVDMSGGGAGIGAGGYGAGEQERWPPEGDRCKGEGVGGVMDLLGIGGQELFGEFQFALGVFGAAEVNG